ncbi:CBS domain-containing protein [Halonotius aquaticus]|uniref:CBS domain-containing protein n=1 Tax=Halonotius aquaticus TaxID=2216978 RepID=A0A3A6QDR8_9EURY|nr:CBS domain-containing protein [Halonotius aquaticus]RJX44200.1 CBS domain-containing protein [Halonotius aquaticus]
MDITDIVAEEFVEVDADERLAKVRAAFDQANPKGVIVTEDGDYAGVIGESELVKSRIQDDTKASVLMTSAPRVDYHEDIRETARLLVEGDVNVAPVFRGETLDGIITTDAILEAVLENLDALTVSQIYTDEVITETTAATVGQAINRLREHGISRLPIVDDADTLTGVITTHDIVNFVVRDENRQEKGDRSGDHDRMLDLPVENLMTSPVLTAELEDSVDGAVEVMFDNDISGLVVTDDDGGVSGIITKTDVLRALTFTEEESMDVQITNVKLLDSIDRAEIVESITQVVDKYQAMNVIHAHVRFHEHKEKLRGTPLIQAQIRLRTSHGQLAGSGEGYGANHAFHVALDKLERNVLERKGVNADAKQRGQLIQNLEL